MGKSTLAALPGLKIKALTFAYGVLPKTVNKVRFQRATRPRLFLKPLLITQWLLLPVLGRLYHDYKDIRLIRPCRPSYRR